MTTKLFLLLTGIALLTACGGGERPDPEIGSAPAVQVPPLPDNLKQPAERLPDIVDGTPGGLTRDGIATDKRYNDVAHQKNAVVTIYECVRQAVNARDASALKQCLD